MSEKPELMLVLLHQPNAHTHLPVTVEREVDVQSDAVVNC